MNYYELVEIIKGVASYHKLVQEVDEGDIYENLNSGVNRYGHVNITTNSISFDENLLNVTMNIFYTDRLQVDTDKNKLQVQSIALMVLYEIMSKLKNGDYDIYIGDTTAQVFEEKFSDLCAGAYMTITVSTPISYVCDDESFEEPEPETAIITYSTTKGTAPEDKEVEIPYTLTAEDLTTLSETGWIFQGWDYSIGDVIEGDTTITASWEQAIPEHDYLKFTSTGNSGVSMASYGGQTINIEYSRDGVTNWTVWDLSNINLSDGETLYFRGNNPNTSSGISKYVRFEGIGSIAQSGNMFSLLNATGEGDTWTGFGEYGFSQLYENFTPLTSAYVPDKTVVTPNCTYPYKRLFWYCTNLNNITALFNSTAFTTGTCLQAWVSSVAAAGTFTKSSAMTKFPSGSNGIPRGWTVINV